jgi:hypothetical protein
VKKRYEMSKAKNPKPKSKSPTPSSKGPRNGRIAAAGLAIVILSTCGFLWSKAAKTDGQAAAVPPGDQTPSTPPASATPISPAMEKLTGKWQRPDGGYVIEINSVEPGGTMDAAYFNPQPINVSRAQAVQDGAVIKVFLELRGANYPGSTYSLAYDVAADQLKGIYFQAAMQQQFEVYFERMK